MAGIALKLPVSLECRLTYVPTHLACGLPADSNVEAAAAHRQLSEALLHRSAQLAGSCAGVAKVFNMNSAWGS